MGPVIDRAALDRSRLRPNKLRPPDQSFSGKSTRRRAVRGGPYVEKTIVTGLDRDHRINRDELFLPFLSILPFDTLDEAIADANRSALA
jgi:1-pyrroline-5-carboxylate dehydrogenase